VDDDIEDAEMGYEIALSTVSNAEPLSYAEALRRPDAEQWKHAALEELNARSTNGTWKLVPQLSGCPPFELSLLFQHSMTTTCA
jgi:hypothetical protein